MTIKKITAIIHEMQLGNVAITTVGELFWVYQQTPAQVNDFNFNDTHLKDSSGEEHA